MRTALLAASFVACSACASDRAHWSGGRKYDLFENAELRVRRARQNFDAKAGEIELAWVAVRAYEGTPDLVFVELTVFDDANGDHQPQESEIVKRLASRERARKVQFPGLRFAWRAGASPLSGLLVARSERTEKRVRWTIAPDSKRTAVAARAPAPSGRAQARMRTTSSTEVGTRTRRRSAASV